MDLVILSNQRFDYPLKTNKWHVATRVAKKGHRVVFVDPPIRIRKVVKLLLTKKLSLKDLIRGYKKESKNLYVFFPVTITPTEKPNLGRFNIWRLKNLLNNLSFKKSRFILWVYHQVMTDYIDSLKYKLLIYDCVDEYSKFPNFVNRGLSDFVSKKEAYVAQRADIVFATTRNLVEKMKKFNKKVFFTPNVGDYERFKDVGTGKVRQAKELNGIKKPIIGFTGAIDEYKLNLPLVGACAKAYPGYSFVLIGPKDVSDKNTNIRSLKKQKNVYFLGKKPYERMPEFFEGFDVYMIPYNLNEYTLGGCFPVKFHDALSSGLPVVVTNLPCYKDFRDVCYIAKDDESFIRLIKVALDGNSEEEIKRRKQVAKKNSWDEKVTTQLGIISGWRL